MCYLNNNKCENVLFTYICQLSPCGTRERSPVIMPKTPTILTLFKASGLEQKVVCGRKIYGQIALEKKKASEA